VIKSLCPSLAVTFEEQNTPIYGRLVILETCGQQSDTETYPCPDQQKDKDYDNDKDEDHLDLLDKYKHK